MDYTEHYDEKHNATYSPEDDKIRLYFGYQIDRELWDSLKAEGFKWTMKQESDMVAYWTPARAEVARQLCGEIEDEGASVLDRSCDRADRFTDYRDSRREDALEHSEKAVDSVGYQSKEKAEKAAQRSDRQKAASLDHWRRAEYWQARAAAVVRHALFKDASDTRARRIARIEADLRRQTLAESWREHLQMRLDYERSILAQQVGTLAADIEMKAGGTLCGKVIHKVSKSSVTKKNVSVSILGKNWHGENKLVVFTLEDTQASEYMDPTPESKAKFIEEKEKLPKKKKLPLINPTREEAEKLQAAWNSEASMKSDGWSVNQEPLEMTQAQYSALSKDTYSHYETLLVAADYTKATVGYVGKNASSSPPAFKVRSAPRNAKLEGSGWYDAERVIIITDKPQKKLPAQVIENVVEAKV